MVATSRTEEWVRFSDVGSFTPRSRDSPWSKGPTGGYPSVLPWAGDTDSADLQVGVGLSPVPYRLPPRLLSSSLPTPPPVSPEWYPQRV